MAAENTQKSKYPGFFLNVLTYAREKMSGKNWRILKMDSPEKKFAFLAMNYYNSIEQQCEHFVKYNAYLIHLKWQKGHWSWDLHCLEEIPSDFKQ